MRRPWASNQGEWAMPEKPPPRKVEIARDDYQPSKAELEADARVDASFEEAIEALARPVEIVRTPRPRRSR